MLLPELTRRLVNGAWIANCSRAHRRFTTALGLIKKTQHHRLLALLRRNAHTRFGEAHGFAGIRSIAEFQQRVPITPYAALAPHIEAIANGETGVLTAEPVRLFQPTSGSTSGTKLIPWTAGVAQEFRCGIDPWLHTLYRRRPELLRGTAYWSISPPSTAPRTHGHLRVGFDHDSSYLGFLGQKLFSLVSAAPAQVAQTRDITEFRTRTLLALLADESLSLISVWSPTFLTTLLDEFLARQDEILALLVANRRSGSRKRAEYLQSLLRTGHTPGLFEQVWPKLAHLSCWTHGPSDTYATNLRRHFPSVEIQGKGLVATEAFVSLPLLANADPVLAVTSHFFEFQSPETGQLSLAHELVAGGEYDVIVTTGGGLYRYPLGDRVRVTGFVQDAPCLRFVGRGNLVSDLFGEKLHGAFVQQVINRALAEQHIQARFALLAPVPAAASTAYTLFLAADTIPSPETLRQSLELGLTENFHYAHCRHLGQLAHSRLFRIQEDPHSAETVFQQEMVSRGAGWGRGGRGAVA
ncbi:MAG: GH3 auxin-responsive promoter family protein [Opitutaceae bacterium]|nr:GH3 auxin-responsive promoter family protein [Opitutaceae bacterium]